MPDNQIVIVSADEIHPGALPVKPHTSATKTTTQTKPRTRVIATGENMPNDDTIATEAKWLETQSEHTSAVADVEQARAVLAQLNERIDEGDDTVTDDDLHRAEITIARTTRFLDGAAARMKAAEAHYRIASADTQLADRLAAAFGRIEKYEWRTPVKMRETNVLAFRVVPFHELANQRPDDSDGQRTIYLSQPSATVRNPRTGTLSGTVVFAAPAEMHAQMYAEHWQPCAAHKAGINLVLHKRGESPALNSGRERLVMANGAVYTVYRAPVVESLPLTPPVITVSDLHTDADYWVRYVSEQIEHGAARTEWTGHSGPLLREVRCLIRKTDASEKKAGKQITRTVVATGSLAMYQGDSFTHLESYVTAPVVGKWLESNKVDNIVPGLGWTTNVAITVTPVGRGMADLSITGTFVSATE